MKKLMDATVPGSLFTSLWKEADSYSFRCDEGIFYPTSLSLANLWYRKQVKYAHQVLNRPLYGLKVR